MERSGRRDRERYRGEMIESEIKRPKGEEARKRKEGPGRERTRTRGMRHTEKDETRDKDKQRERARYQDTTGGQH